MNRGNFFRRTFSMLFFVAIMTFAAVSHAEIYIGEGSYCMSEGENLGVAKERAKADAMRNACEKAGTYVKSYSRARNLELEEDIIETMTANILKLIEEKYLPYEQLDNLEGLMIRIVIKVQIDDSDITRWLNKDNSEKSMLVSQMESLRKANEEQARQIEELKRQLVNNPQDRKQITKKFEAEDKIFLSNQKVEEGWKLRSKKDFNGAVIILNEAIELNPRNTRAYFGRGTAYTNLKQYERAIQDFNKAIQLNPNWDYPYTNRGRAYYLNKQYELAIQDYNEAIKFNPNSYWAYNNRGVAYGCLEQYERAIKDFDKAISLNPKEHMAYGNRGLAYYYLKNYKQAFVNLNKAIELSISEENLGETFYYRGLCYRVFGDEAKAQADLAKSKKLAWTD